MSNRRTHHRLMVVGIVVCAVAFGCKPREGPPVRGPRRAEVTAPLGYELVGTLDGAMERLNGVAVGPGDAVYLAGSAGVRVIDRAGNELQVIKTGGPATCVAVAPDGDVFVGLRAKVERYNRGGRLVTSWGREGRGRGEFRAITSLAVAGSDVYVADAGNRRVHHFAANGDFVDAIDGRAPDGTGPGFIVPSEHLDVVVARDGVLHITNPGTRRIERYGANGTLIGSWGRFGDEPEAFYGCCNPTDIALLPGGRTVTAEKGRVRVKVYDNDGRMLAHIGPQNFSRKAQGLDLAVDSAGRIYVADPGNGKVRVIQLVEPEATDEG